jgi:hypothetical protein
VRGFEWIVVIRFVDMCLDVLLASSSSSSSPCSRHVPLAKGDLNGKQAGKFSSIAKEAAGLSPEEQPPTVLIETLNRNLMVKDYDSMTIVISCSRSEE